MKIQISKIIGAITGVAVAASCITPFYIPDDSLTVYADFGDFGGAVDYILSVEDADAIALSTGGGAAVSGALLGVYLCTQNPLAAGGYYNMSNITVIDGLYIYNNHYHLGYEMFTNISSSDYSNDAPYTFATAKDFNIVCTGPITNCSSNVSFNNNFSLGFDSSSGSSNLAITNNSGSLFTSGSYSSQSYHGSYYYFFYGSLSTSASIPDWDLTPTASLSSIFNVNSGLATNVIRPSVSVQLPSGEMDPAHPEIYIENVLRPWVVENYPDFEYLLPTDEDPELPTSPTIDFTIPTADYTPLDPSEVLDDYSMSSSFWWDLTSDILDDTGLKALALFGFSLAIIGYFVWKLGR